MMRAQVPVTVRLDITKYPSSNVVGSHRRSQTENVMATSSEWSNKSTSQEPRSAHAAQALGRYHREKAQNYSGRSGWKRVDVGRRSAIDESVEKKEAIDRRSTNY